jgi:ribulose-phosphate 3-epimerase
MPKRILIPAILAQDSAQLQSIISQIEDLVEYIQIDYMDGKFVKQKSNFDHRDLYQINPIAKPELHLMVEHPEKIIEKWITAGVEKFIIHAEAPTDWHAIKDIYEDNFIKIYLALNPDTPINKILDKMQIIDGITIMGVNPGRGRQKFVPKVLGKIKSLRNRFPDLNIQIDGGMHTKPTNTIRQAILAGANEIVAGSEIFLSGNIIKKVDELYQEIHHT